MAELATGHVVAHRYRVTGALGRGGMGAVYLATQEPLGREVALKVLNTELSSSTEARERFLREAQAVSRLNHPNVVTVHDFGQDTDGMLYLVMEHVVGRPLRSLMEEAGAMPAFDALTMVRDAARGIAAAHANGIVHGDLKPENLLVSSSNDRHVKVLDFGLARLSSTKEGQRLTREGTILGTPLYMSPEHVKGIRDDPRSDVYALGVVLYEMLVGVPPFDADTAAMIIVQHMTEAPPAMSSRGTSSVSPTLESFVRSLLAKDPSERPANGAALVEGLDAQLSVLEKTRTLLDSHVPTQSLDVVIAPTGNVSLVFTDVESSSTLWERVPALMREALRIHDAVLRAAMTATNGYEVKTQGDSFMVAFHDVKDAVQFCCHAQESLLQAPWSDALVQEPEANVVEADGVCVSRGLRVRMGVFTGEPDCRIDPVNGRMDYFGPMVNRAARVESAAWGGQVLIGTAGSVDDLEIPSTVFAKDYGPARLKGIDVPIRLVELTPPTLRARVSPPPRTLDEKRPSNLPASRGALMGRGPILARSRNALRSARVLTLTGVAGVGKSRVAIEVARLTHDENRVSTWHLSLADDRDVLSSVARLARVLDVVLLNAKSVADASAQLSTVLMARGDCLIVFDDADRVLGDEFADVLRTLTEPGNTSIILTARSPSRCVGEVVVDVPVLDVADARALFFARASESGVQLSDSEGTDVDALCRALDGLPLAIELAASRTRVIRPAKMLERLGKRFDLLKGAQRTGRGSTLKGALDLSWDLLDALERLALIQCTVFAGGFSLEAAEATLDLSSVDDAAFVLDVLDGLREKSLLRTEHHENVGELRFVMYESVKAYAREADPTVAGESELWRRFARFVVDTGQEASALAHTTRSNDAMARISVEAPHLHAVATGTNDALAVHASMVLAVFYGFHGPVALHRAVVDDAIERAERAGDAPLILQCSLVKGRFEAFNGNPDDASQILARCVALAEQLHDDRALAYAHQARVRTELRELRFQGAHETMHAAHTIATTLGDDRLLALLANERMLFAFAPTIDESTAEFQVALRHARRAGDRELECRIQSNMGISYAFRQLPDESLEHFRIALELARDIRSRHLEGLILGNLLVPHILRGEIDDAIASGQAAIPIHEEVGSTLLMGADLASLGAALFCAGRIDEAAAAIARARDITHGLHAHREYATALFWSGIVELHRGNVVDARAYFLEPEGIGREMPHLGFTELIAALVALTDLFEAVRESSSTLPTTTTRVSTSLTREEATRIFKERALELKEITNLASAFGLRAMQRVIDDHALLL